MLWVWCGAAQLAKERKQNRELREVKESLEAASVGQLSSRSHLPQQQPRQPQPRQPHVWTEYPPIATVMPDATDDGPSPLRPLQSEHVSPQQYNTNNAPWLAAGGPGVDSMSDSWAREAQQPHHRSPMIHANQQQPPAYAHGHHDPYAPPAPAVLSPAVERRQRAAGAAERRLARAGAGASVETQQPQMLRRREDDEDAGDGADDTTELASVRASAVSVVGGDGGTRERESARERELSVDGESARRH